MIIDKIDLLILRYLEKNGYCLNSLAAELSIELKQIQDRLEKLKDNNVITDYRATIFVPPFLGGPWTWGCVLVNTKNRNHTLEIIQQKIPFMTEIWLNSNLPLELGHNLSFMFYSKNFNQQLQFIKEIEEITNIVAYCINEYSYPMPRIFSPEEKQLLKYIYKNPTADFVKLSEICQKNVDWIKTKCERLIWTPHNPDGVIYTIPEIQYSQIENYCHCHFLVETTENINIIMEELKASDFQLIINQTDIRRPDSKQHYFFQIETDLWGFNDYLIKKAHLDSFRELKIKGFILAEKMIIPTYWQSKLLEI